MNRFPRLLPTLSRNAAIALTLVLGGGLGGCETIAQDLNDFGKSIIPPSPAEAARMALDPYDADRRREGTLLLSNAPFGGSEAYLQMYRDYVANERDPLVRAVAIRALGRHGGPADAPRLARQLRDENVQVRWEAAKALQRIHNPAVVSELLAASRRTDEYTGVRVATAIALGQYQEDRAFQGLVRALDARELAINLAADESLQVLTGQSFGLDPRAWLTWYNAHADDPFADGREYVYPTYQRDESFMEKLAFWSSTNYETPAQPAGLRPRSERQTYQDDSTEDDDADADATENAGGS